MNKKKLLIISAFISINSTITTPKAFGQIFSNSQNPLSVQWRQINSNGFKIIFPKEMQTEAERMAYTLPYVFDKLNTDLKVKNNFIPIVIQNQGTLANGFVQLGPKKSEFFSTPPQNFDSQDWLNNLAIHELRHVIQFDKLTYNQKKPFPELLYFGYFGLALPTWFFEGDAVLQETKWSEAGRGRQPSWIMPYRTSLLEGKRISYSKAYFGSTKDVNVGYYQTGYLNMSHLVENFGDDVTDRLLNDISHRPIRLFPFSNSLKKISKKNTSQWFLETQKNVAEKWTIQKEKTSSKNYSVLNRNTKIATNYFLPTKIADNKILTLKESKAETSHFVLIDSNKNERKLFGIGYQEQPYFSYQNNKIVWDEIHYDLRYKNRSFSVIYVYDFLQKKIKQITHKSRLFSPSLSADGKKIIAVNIDYSNRFNLVEINSENGDILHRYPNPKNLILQAPSFHPDGKQITYISLSEKGKNLELLNGTENSTLISESRQQLNFPKFVKNGIAFNAHFNGIDNIYFFDLSNKEISALTQSQYGAFNFSLDNNDHFTFNDYKVNGLEISAKKLETYEKGENNFVNFSVNDQEKKDSLNIFKNLIKPDTNYNSKPYRQFSNLFNFHSIVPVIDDEYTYGLELQSNNLLNTMSVYSGLKYHSDLKRVEYYADINYKALYPIVSLLYRNRARRTFYNTNIGTKQGDWRENYAKLNISLPLSFNDRNWNYNFALNIGTSFTKRYQPIGLPNNFILEQKFPMEYGFTFNRNTRKSDKDLASKWSQIIRVSYANQPFDKYLNGEVLALESFFYFPGLAKNHSFLTSFNYQHAIGANRYAQEISTVYGYNNILAKNKLQNTLLFNYRFPIAFPDLELGPVAYIRNFRAGVFSHYENIGIQTNIGQPKTYGFEFNTSLNLLRYQPIVDIGARIVFVNKIYNQKPILEFSFNYTL